MSYEQFAQTPGYRNWVKSGIGLKYLKDGLAEFVDRNLKSIQNDFLYDICKHYGLQEAKCTQCTTANILACPTAGMCNLRQRGGICSYHDKTNPRYTSRPCPNNICESLREKILYQHRYNKASWKNTDARKWCTDHFELGKCYLPAIGYDDKTSVTEMDCSGILNILINCIPMQNQLTLIIQPPQDIISKLIKTRNKILHSASLTMTGAECNQCLDEMISLLQDKNTLSGSQEAQDAKCNLLKIRNGSLYISTEDELDLRRTALNALEEKKNEALLEIEIQQDNVLKILNENYQSKIQALTTHQEDLSRAFDQQRGPIQAQVQSIATRQGSVEVRQQSIENEMKNLQTTQHKTNTDLLRFQNEFLTFKASISGLYDTERCHKERLEYLQGKQDLQHVLCKLYEDQSQFMPICPLFDVYTSIVDIFVEPNMTKSNRTTDFTETENNKSRTFQINLKEVLNGSKHYLIGNVGMGKTTWCINICHKWTSSIKKRAMKQTLIEKQALTDEEQILPSIDLLLYVSLQHATTDVNVIDMLKHQLFEEHSKLYDNCLEVLNKEPKRCCIILDGLDEWNPPLNLRLKSPHQDPELPGRKHLNGCRVLTTTRPWKLLTLRCFDNFSCVNLLGIVDENKLVQNVLKHFSGTTGLTDKEIENKTYHTFCRDVETSFYKKKIDDKTDKASKSFNPTKMPFFKIPLVLTFMICQWVYDGNFETTMAATVSGLIEMLIRISESDTNSREIGRLFGMSGLQDLKSKWSESSDLLPECLNRREWCKMYSGLLMKLAKLAYDSLFENQNSNTVFDNKSVMAKLSNKELEVALKIGILSKSKLSNRSHNFQIMFFHRIMQEFFAALFLVLKENALEKYNTYCVSEKTVVETKNVFLFVCGMHYPTARQMSKHIANVVEHGERKLFGMLSNAMFEVEASHRNSQEPLDNPIVTNQLLHSEYGSISDISVYESNKHNITTVDVNFGDKKPIKFALMSWLPLAMPHLTKLTMLRIRDFDIGQLIDLSQCVHLQLVNLKNVSNCELKLNSSTLQKLSLQRLTSSTITVQQIGSSSENKLQSVECRRCLKSKIVLRNGIWGIQIVTFSQCETCCFEIVDEKNDNTASSIIDEFNLEEDGTMTELCSNLKIEHLSIITNKSILDYVSVCSKANIVAIDYLSSDCISESVLKLQNLTYLSCRQLPKCYSKDVSYLNPIEKLQLTNVENLSIDILGDFSNLQHLICNRFSSSHIQRLVDVLPVLTKLTFLAIHQVSRFEYTSLITLGKIIPTLRHIQALNLSSSFKFPKELLNQLQFLPRLKRLSLVSDNKSQMVVEILSKLPNLEALKLSSTLGDGEQTKIPERHSTPFDPNKRVSKSESLYQRTLNLKQLELVMCFEDYVTEYIPYFKQIVCLNCLKCTTDFMCEFNQTFEGQYTMIHLQSILIVNIHTTSLERPLMLQNLENIRHFNINNITATNMRSIMDQLPKWAHIESLTLKSINLTLEDRFIASLPVTKKPIDIHLSGIWMEYGIIHNLKCKNWLKLFKKVDCGISAPILHLQIWKILVVD